MRTPGSRMMYIFFDSNLTFFTSLFLTSEIATFVSCIERASHVLLEPVICFRQSWEITVSLQRAKDMAEHTAGTNV